MSFFAFHCPNTGFQVHAWTKGEDSGASHIYEAVTCIACQRTHLVNFNTGRVLGNDKEAVG
jgi:hypothetical protein